MSIQEFTALWQARPFRAFRLHTKRGVFSVGHPLATALTPAMRVAVIASDTHAESLALEEIERAEVHGMPIAPTAALEALAPETLARHAQLLSQLGDPAPSRPQKARKPAFDPGTVAFQTATQPDGTFVVHATVSTRDGTPIFTTAGTRWNLHGTDRFENGTHLYLHHLDHPTTEQRLIVWPPDTGSFDSFGESQPLPTLRRELEERAARLAAKPARPFAPPAAWFNRIQEEYPVIPPDGRAAAFGADPDDDFDRFELRLAVPRRKDGRRVHNPCLVDVLGEAFLFNLVDTDWHATFQRVPPTFTLTLHHVRCEGSSLEIEIEPRRLIARIDRRPAELPLGFVERTLRNFELYARWDLMLAALHAGPPAAKKPDVVLPLAPGYFAELWSADPTYPLPFLQPRILGRDGGALLDLRTTAWATRIQADPTQPRLTLQLLSHEEKKREAGPKLELQLDLVTRRVTCAGRKGTLPLGMLQKILHHARGLKWLGEELSAWFDKAKPLPAP